MKKLLAALGVIIALVAICIAGYLYWLRVNVEPKLQTVALDNPQVDSFDDVCTEDENSTTLNCKGNIQEFGCDWYSLPDFSYTDLQPTMPFVLCENRLSAKNQQYVYIQGSETANFSPIAVSFIVIKDGLFQLITSSEEYREIFQPIESIAEATVFFQGLHVAHFIVDDAALDILKKGESSNYLVSTDAFTPSTVFEEDSGYSINAYSATALDCKTQLFSYDFLVKRDGEIVEKNKKLLWENKSNYCLD